MPTHSATKTHEAGFAMQWKGGNFVRSIECRTNAKNGLPPADDFRKPKKNAKVNVLPWDRTVLSLPSHSLKWNTLRLEV